MKITTIIVTKDDDERLTHTLLSIDRQVFLGKSWEILVFDGSSSAKTRSLVEKLIGSHLNYVYAQGEDSGVYDAMNKAVEMASGEFVHFLNCGDSLSQTDSMSKILELVESSQTFYTWNLFDQERQIVLSLEHLNLWTLIAGTSDYCHQGQMMSKKLFNEIGMLNRDLKLCSDFEMTLKLMTVTTPVNLPEILVNYQGSGLSRRLPGLLLDEKRQAIRNWQAWLSVQEVRVSRFMRFYAFIVNSSTITFKIQRRIASIHD
jgi:hypothetical protein